MDKALNTDRISADTAKINLTNALSNLEWERQTQLIEMEAAQAVAKTGDKQAAVDADQYERNVRRIEARIEAYEARRKVIDQAGKTPAR